MPELLVGVDASVRDSGDIAIGTVVGSNIANIALILGVAALIRPINIQMRLLVREVPIMIGLSFMFYVLAFDGELTRWDGGALIVGLLLYTLYLLRGARKEPPVIEAEYSPGERLRGAGATRTGGHNRRSLWALPRSGRRNNACRPHRE